MKWLLFTFNILPKRWSFSSYIYQLTIPDYTSKVYLVKLIHVIELSDLLHQVTHTLNLFLIISLEFIIYTTLFKAV